MLLDLAPLAFASSSSTYSVDCEGACCCRCNACAGEGWWSSYDITFPTSDGEVRCISGVRTFVPGASDVIANCISGNTYSLAAAGINYIYGSSGGSGECRWSSSYTCFGGGGGGITMTAPISGPAQLLVSFSGVCVPGVIYNVISFDCRTGGSFSGDPFVDCTFFACANNPHFPSAITIVPSAGATWQQCGLNADGTTFTESGMAPLMGMLSKAFGAKVASIEPRPLPVIRPDRCEHLGKRNDFKAGCNGWQCGHSCDLGLPAVPGIYCQTECTKYEVDPDYIGQGPAGWLK